MKTREMTIGDLMIETSAQGVYFQNGRRYKMLGMTSSIEIDSYGTTIGTAFSHEPSDTVQADIDGFTEHFCEPPIADSPRYTVVFTQITGTNKASATVELCEQDAELWRSIPHMIRQIKVMEDKLCVCKEVMEVNDPGNARLIFGKSENPEYDAPEFIKVSGLDITNPTKGAHPPMVWQSWRYGFNGEYFGFMDNGPFVAVDAILPELEKVERERDMALKNYAHATGVADRFKSKLEAKQSSIDAMTGVLRHIGNLAGVQDGDVVGLIEWVAHVKYGKNHQENLQAPVPTLPANPAYRSRELTNMECAELFDAVMGANEKYLKSSGLKGRSDFIEEAVRGWFAGIIGALPSHTGTVEIVTQAEIDARQNNDRG